jgi:nicotinamide mononucleotide transporter
MTVSEIVKALDDSARQMSWQEWAAVLFSIASVLFARANSIWLYPTGIAGILFSIYIFIEAQYKLYPDAALNLYYLIMSIYGWYLWSRKDSEKHDETPISWCSKKDWFTASTIFIVLWITLYWWLSTYKINNVPLYDSFSSAMAATGMWLLAKRKVENWIALLIADAVDIFMFFIKKLILFCCLNVFYVIIAWIGYLAWKKMWKEERVV